MLQEKLFIKLIRDYLRCAATVDDNIGKLLDALDEMGIADNTIVVYVADQGYFLGEHGFYDKRMFYEESARMPFVIRYPKCIPAGKRVNELVLNVDFASTLCDFAGVKSPEGTQAEVLKMFWQEKLLRTGGRVFITVIGLNMISVRPTSVYVMSVIS